MKRFAALLLALSLCLTGVSAAEVPPAQSSAQFLNALGLFQGTDAGYELERVPTRQEGVTLLIRLLGREAEARAGSWSTPFTDVDPWAAPYVGCAYANGLTQGVSGTAFGASAPLTAQQYDTFLLRALGYESGADFSWDAAEDYAQSLGLPKTEAPFTRGGAALLSRSALDLGLKSAPAVTLADSLLAGGVFSADALADARRGERPETASSTLTVRFFDVGQGDCALLQCGGQSMLIDGGETDQSSRVYTYLKDLNVTYLDYVVASHAHSDHVGGLSGALNYATAGAALCPVTSYSSSAFEHFTQQLAKQNVAITVPQPGDVYPLGGATVEVLGPWQSFDDPNNTSLVLKAAYGSTSFLFTGDAERPAEQDLLDRSVDLSATVLKVGHHGSDTSTTYPFLRAVDPQYAVISVGAGNAYGHPTDAALSRLSDAGAITCRTDLQGTVTCVSDGVSVTVSTQKAAPAPPAPAIETTCVGNVNSHKFHRPTCPSLPAPQNQIPFSSRQQALDAGYTPCGVCDP